MKKIAILLAAVIGFVAAAEAYVVVDNGDKTPVIGATVIGKSGIILGQTDGDGRISGLSRSELPITVRCLGYEQIEYAGVADTISLIPADYPLSEVVVSPAERPITRVVCYGREYCSGVTHGDTMQLYCEYMAEAFLVDGKVKGYKKSDANFKIKNTKMYARIAKSDGRDSVFTPSDDDNVGLLVWFPYMASFPDQTVGMSQALIQGAEADTLMGKYAPKVIQRKKNNTFTRSLDYLSDHEGGKWSPTFLKLLGMSSDITGLTSTASYAINDRGLYGIYDFVSAACNIHILAKGKIIKRAMGSKDSIEMDSYFEFFPMEITHCTVDEYKELRSDKSPIPFNAPSDLPPLTPAIYRLINVCPLN